MNKYLRYFGIYLLVILTIFTVKLSLGDSYGAVKLDVPNDFKVVKINTTSVNLKWDKVKYADGYVVAMTNLSTNKSYGRLYVGNDNTSVLRDNLMAGYKYKFKVRAYKIVAGKKVYGKYSKAITLTTKKNTKSSSVPVTKIKKAAFELPIAGATGYGIVKLNMRKSNSSKSKLVTTIKPGEPFKIISESGKWWKVEYNKKIGYVYYPHCMINLPDVMPSVIYDIVNAYSAKYISSGKSLDGLTGEKLYKMGTKENKGKVNNQRLNKLEYIVPISYDTAKSIAAAQKAALNDGYSLYIYDTYRPVRVQKSVANELKALANKDSEVRKGITKKPWSISWFISTKSVGNHQKGYAIDLSLVKVKDFEIETIKSKNIKKVKSFTNLKFPSEFDELSIKAIKYNKPISSRSKTAWKKGKYVKGTTSGVKRLNIYMTRAGLTPLASEWWHFNDLEIAKTIDKLNVKGNFDVTKIVSE